MSRSRLLLPVWFQQEFAGWSLFGGGGYDINPGRNAQNFWISGLALTRQVNDRLQVGAEVYRQTAAERPGKDFSGLNFGCVWRVAPHWSFLFAGGPGLENPQLGRASAYLALKADY